MDIKKLQENLNNLTGEDVLRAETKSRAMGDQTPDISFSKRFQALLVAKALEVDYKEVMQMKANDFNLAATAVANFLLGGLVDQAAQAKPSASSALNL